MTPPIGMTVQRVWRTIVLVLGCGGLVNCGGDSQYAPLRPAGTLHGVAHDGPIVGGIVNVYAFGNGTRGALLGSAITDDNGAFSLAINVPGQPLLFELEDGRYREESSGVFVPLRAGRGLKAVAMYDTGVERTIAITPLSLLATGLAEFQIAQGTAAADAVKSATATVSALFGVSDVVATRPINITSTTDYGTVDDRAVYAFVLGSLSSYTAWLARRNNNAPHEEFSSLQFANLMYEDVRYDGLLDGRGPPDLEAGKSALQFANVALSQDLYRQAIAQHMLVMASSKSNITGISARELLADASSFAASDSPMFPGGGVVPRFDFIAPAITATDPVPAYYRGVFDLKVRVTDESPVRLVSFNIDGDHLADAVDPNAAVVSIDSSRYADGPHVLGVTAFDEVGNLGNFSIDVQFDNTAPVIKITSPSLTNLTVFNLTGGYEREGSALRRFTVQGRDVILNADLSWSTRVLLNSGQNKVLMVAEDVAGNRYSAETLIAVDGKAPEMVGASFSEQIPYYIGGGQCQMNRFDVATPEGAPLYFNRAKLGTGLEPPYSWFRLLNTGVPYIRFYVTDPLVEGVGSNAADVVVKMTYTIGDQDVLRDQKLQPHADPEPTAPYYLIPIASDLLPAAWPGDGSQVHSISVTLEDEAGNRNVPPLFPLSFRVFVGSGACPSS